MATAGCRLGRVLVAVSDRGICAILLGDDDEALHAELRGRFPRAACTSGEGALAATVAAVVALVDDPGVGLGLPLDIQGTAFQRRVWEALRAIPVGARRTYREVAEAMGQPTAARAVASACAANPLAVAVPCHRVVRAGGALSGYRWGVERKRALLAAEEGS